MIRLQVIPTSLNLILSAFHGRSDGAVSAGHHSDENVSAAVCRQDFGSVHDAEASACAGSEIEYAATLLSSRNYALHELFNLRDCLPDGYRHIHIFCVDTLEDICHAHLVQIVVMRRLFGRSHYISPL